MECYQTLRGHTSGVTSLAFDKKNNYLFSGSYDCTIRVYYISTFLT